MRGREVTDVVLLAPRRADGGHRDRLWSHSRRVWSEMFPDWTLVEGHHDHGPFNRSAAINQAAEAAGPWNVAVIIDCDVLPVEEAVRRAVKVASSETRAAAGFDVRLNLNQRGTEKILRGYKGPWERMVQSKHPLCKSGALAVSRELWDAVGGFDELFVGWGFEDTAFEIACHTVSGQDLWKPDGVPLWHLWHPRSPEHNIRTETFKANRARLNRYQAVDGDKRLIKAILEESTAEYERVTGPDRTIPRILHRTVPKLPSQEAQDFWMQAIKLHPDWIHMDHRDPLEPGMYPETGHLWRRCKSGAQKAGLIRLEVLWSHGGIYIDSDVELYRSLEPLLDCQGFAAWEDRKVVPDAVMGFMRHHPAVRLMLDRAILRVERGEGAWISGPGVTTDTLPGREDVLLLPPGSFYPYHYKEKHRRDDDHRTEQPWAFGAHHWAHSWAGK